MIDDEILARVLRRYLADGTAYAYWDCHISERMQSGELTLDGSVKLTYEEAVAIRRYKLNPEDEV